MEKVTTNKKYIVTRYQCDTCEEGFLQLKQDWSLVPNIFRKYYYECDNCRTAKWSDLMYDRVEMLDAG